MLVGRMSYFKIERIGECESHDRLQMVWHSITWITISLRLCMGNGMGNGNQNSDDVVVAALLNGMEWLEGQNLNLALSA